MFLARRGPGEAAHERAQRPRVPVGLGRLGQRFGVAVGAHDILGVTQTHTEAGLRSLDTPAARAQPRSERLGRYRLLRLACGMESLGGPVPQGAVGVLAVHVGELAHQLEQRPRALTALGDVRNDGVVLARAHEIQRVVVAWPQARLVGAHRTAADAGPHREALRSLHRAPRLALSTGSPRPSRGGPVGSVLSARAPRACGGRATRSPGRRCGTGAPATGTALSAPRIAERLTDGDAFAGWSVGGAGRDAVLGEPARQVLAGDLALRPPQRRALGVAAPLQAARAAPDEQPAVDHRLAGVGGVLRRRPGARWPRPLAVPGAWRRRRT